MVSKNEDDDWGSDGQYLGVTTVGEGVTVKPGVCGGKACLEGTRMPIWAIEGARRAGQNVNEILSSYPHLSTTSILEAWEYADNNREEIERDLQEQDEESEETDG